MGETARMTRAAVLRAPGQPLELVDVDLAPTGPGQVRVRLAATGVCHSDLSIATGAIGHPVPVVLGHEGAGVVTEVGDGVTRVAVGDHVVLSWTPACGECFFCLRGEPYLCARAVADAAGVPYATLDGVPLSAGLSTAAFAEETLVLDRAVVRIDDSLPLATAALVGCAVMTGFGAVVNTAKVLPGSTVVVIGCGGVGLSVIEGARYAGAGRIIAVDLVEQRRALALRVGATDAIDGAHDVKASVRALTDGIGADYSFEVIGRAATIKTAWQVTRRGGTVVVVGVGRRDDAVEFNALELSYQARTVIGCMYGSAHVDRDFPRLLELNRSGALDLDALITDRIRLDDVNDAFARMQAGEGARSVIVF